MARHVVMGRYRLVERLGAGGMGEVWLAEDLELEREVAFKRLGPGADPARFVREARAAAALTHPNICRLYDYGEFESGTFMVLEYLPGGTLGDRLEPATPLSDGEAARILFEVAEALAYAHSQGVVHRDLKPVNILFDAEGRAKICDFGVARLVDASTLTEAGTVLGTAAYMSPEQAGAEPATPASDVYSLGVIGYQMLAGRLPFESKSPIELARQHREVAPPPLASLRPDLQPQLERVTMAALAKDPRQRPADGGALLEALRPSEADATAILPAEAPTQIVAARAPRRPSSRWLAAGLAGTLLLGGGLGLALALDHGSASHPATRPGASGPATEQTRSGGTASISAPSRTSTGTTREATTTAPRPTTHATTATTARASTSATTTAPTTATTPTTTAATTSATTTATTTAPTTTSGTTG